MSRYTGPSWKVSRRLGISLSGTGKELARRPYAPGQHGQNNRRKLSEYGLQLREKQKLRMTYGLSERQFANLFVKAGKIREGKHGDNFMILLERRLDNVVYRLGFANSRNQARQLVRHGLFTLNGHKVNIPSIQLRVGDSVEIPEKNRQVKIFADAQETIGRRGTPNWLEADYDAFKGTVKAMPQREDIRTEVNEQLIVELYSK